jgi:hypothetical protein
MRSGDENDEALSVGGAPHTTVANKEKTIQRIGARVERDVKRCDHDESDTNSESERCTF